MTVQELLNWCTNNNVPLDTPIALMDESDGFFLLEKNVTFEDAPYFGNSREGEEWIEANAPKDESGDIDYDNLPKFLILDIGR